MPADRSRFTLILLTAVASLLVGTSHAVSKRKHAAKQPVKQEQAAPPVETVTPPVPLTPEQMPAVPPQVTYQNGQLTIVAENSTLGDILRAVRHQTGAAVDIPASANSRVATRLGPGPSRDVLASLLNGTLFNYVLLGKATDPAAVGRIILTPKPTGAPGDTTQSPQISFPMGRPQGSYPTANLQEQMADEPDTESTEDSANEQDAQPAGSPNPQPGVKTPEQLLQELQRQQQQLQMQQQESNPPTPEQHPPQ